MTDSTRRVVLGISIGSIVILAGILAAAPALIEAWNQRKTCIAAFQIYASQLQRRDYESAWHSLGPKLQNGVSLPEFMSMHLDLVKEYGELKSVRADKTVVEGAGNPVAWIGNIDSTLQYERKNVRVRYELHKTGDMWRVHGFERQGE